MTRRAVWLSIVSVVAVFAMMATRPALAQQFNRVYPLGLATVEPEQVEGLPVVELTRAYIPDAIDLSDRLPIPGDQGKVGSCVSWATAYAARSYYRFVETGAARNDPRNIASPSYLHDRLRDPKEACKDSGSHIFLALKYLEGNGLPALTDYGLEAMCNPGAAKVSNPPLGFRIRQGRLIYLRRKDDRSSVSQAVLDKIKLSLANGDPVLMGMIVDKRLMALSGSTVYAEVLGPSPHASAASQYGPPGGHAMLIVGYDERRQAFRILNSWGTDWADGGYGWVSYKTLRSDLTSAGVMDTGIKVPKPVPNRPLVAGKSDVKLECGDVRLKETEQRVTLSGFVASQADKIRLEDSFRTVAAAVGTVLTSEVAVRPWPICEALLTLAEPLQAPVLPKLATTSGRTTLHYNDTMGLTVTAPDFPSFLYLVYLQADGKAVNLLPRRGQMRQQTPPGTVLTFGDGQEGRARFKVSPPSGTEAVIAIAARSPIAELEALESDGAIYKVAAAAKNPLDNSDSPPDRAFLSALRTGLLSRPDQAALPREVAAAVLHLTVEP